MQSKSTEIVSQPWKQKVLAFSAKSLHVTSVCIFWFYQKKRLHIWFIQRKARRSCGEILLDKIHRQKGSKFGFLYYFRCVYNTAMTQNKMEVAKLVRACVCL